MRLRSRGFLSIAMRTVKGLGVRVAPRTMTLWLLWSVFGVYAGIRCEIAVGCSSQVEETSFSCVTTTGHNEWGDVNPRRQVASPLFFPFVLFLPRGRTDESWYSAGRCGTRASAREKAPIRLNAPNFLSYKVTSIDGIDDMEEIGIAFAADVPTITRLVNVALKR